MCDGVALSATEDVVSLTRHGHPPGGRLSLVASRAGGSGQKALPVGLLRNFDLCLKCPTFHVCLSLSLFSAVVHSNSRVSNRRETPARSRHAPLLFSGFWWPVAILTADFHAFVFACFCCRSLTLMDLLSCAVAVLCCSTETSDLERKLFKK